KRSTLLATLMKIRTKKFTLVSMILSAIALSPPSSASATTYSTWHDALIKISNGQTFATLNIPESGSYVIFAKLDLVNDSSTQHTLDCKLNAAPDFDEAIIRLGSNALGASGGHLNGEMVFNVVHVFSGTNNVVNLSRL